jgi:hypothetical protein
MLLGPYDNRRDLLRLVILHLFAFLQLFSGFGFVLPLLAAGSNGI